MQVYPLLCQKINDGSFLGKVIGMDLELIDSSISKLKKTAAEEIRRIHKNTPYETESPLSKAILRFAPVEISLAYASSKGPYSIDSTTKFRIAAIYGEVDEYACFRCFLPFLDKDFFYYNDQQLMVLIEHFSKEHFDEIPPEEAHRYLLTDVPWLEELQVKLPIQPKRPKGNLNMERYYDDLRTVAEKLPIPRSANRRMHIIPEIAWEQGDIIRTSSLHVLEENANLLMVGERGVGKSVVLMDIIKNLDRTTKKQYRPLTIWKSNPQRLVANAKYLGEWQEICEELVENLEQVNGILWITDITQLLKSGGEGAEDSMASFLLPFIRQGTLRIIAEITPRELEAARNILPGFMENFRQVELNEMDQIRTLRVMDQFKKYISTNLHLEITDSAVELCYRITKRFMTYERFPGKCIHLLGECVKIAQCKNIRKIEEKQVIDSFLQKTGLPEIIVRDDIPFAENEMVDYFSMQIMGQEEPVKQLSSVVNIYKAGLNDPNKPIATLLFAGPTGTGKTLTAKILAEFFFSSGQKQDPLFRIDMSEFQHPYQVSRLIGQPDGTPGKLLQHVCDRPFSVILFDEIEKADPSFFDVLLNIMDEGQFSDAAGRTADFRSSILILTTNLGSQNSKIAGFQKIEVSLDSAIKSFFRPEFFNRIDQVLQFQPLNQETIEQIAQKELKQLSDREGFVKRQITLDFTPSLIEFIANTGFSPKYGARPLQRAIEQNVVTTLGKYLLENTTLINAVLEVDFLNREVVIQKSQNI